MAERIVGDWGRSLSIRLTEEMKAIKLVKGDIAEVTVEDGKIIITKKIITKGKVY